MSYKLDFLQTPRLDEKPDPDIKLLLSEALTRSLLLSRQSTLSLHTTACQQQEIEIWREQAKINKPGLSCL